MRARTRPRSLRSLAALGRGVALAALVALAASAQLPPLPNGEPSSNDAPASEEPANAAAPDAADIEAARVSLAGELAALRAEDPQPRASIAMVERLDSMLAEHATLLGRMESATGDEAPPEPPGPPYALADIDETARRLAEAEAARARTRSEIAAAQAAVERARSDLEAAERKRRLRKEQLAKGETTPGLLRKAELAGRLANAEIALHRAELRYAQRRLESAEASLGPLEAALAEQEAVPSASTAQLEDVLAAIDKQLFDLERAEQKQQFARAEAERQLEREIESANGSPESAARVEARRIAAAGEQRIQSLLSDHRARLEASKEIWRNRFALARGAADVEQCSIWIGEVDAALADLERSETLGKVRLGELEVELGGLAPELPASAILRSSLQRRIDAYRSDLSRSGEHRFLLERFATELREHASDLGLRDRLSVLASQLRAVWDYEVWVAGDNPITVGKLLRALLVFVLGFYAVRWIARALRAYVFPRLGLDAGGARAFESLTFYALLIALVLLVLDFASIPLTAFAFVGGALAIGVGFGSQNIVNNFISGVILLAERPVKIGDLVEVGGDVYGLVEQIGLRSTRIRTGTNIHIVVPNASILENQVVNWTLNDANVRLVVKVGVAYGSPTREVERLLLQALSENPRVHPNPPPVVLFADFGDNALAFEAHFWAAIRKLMDRLTVESELRFRIDELFREAGITIAFPQRDVHLDTLSPLEVRVVRESGDRSAS